MYRDSHNSYNLVNIFIDCFKACMIDLKSFGSQTSKNVQDILKFDLVTCMCDLSVPSMFGCVSSIFFMLKFI